MKRPHRFTIEITPAFTLPTRYSVDRGVIEVRVGAELHRSTTPTLTQWSGFWRLCEFLDLWNWEQEYHASEHTRDGQSWALNIAYDKKKKIESSGDNCYPSLESAQQSRITMDRFGLLLHFIDISLLTARYDMRDDFSELDS